MSRFYASIQGNKGEATRMGTANSGMTGHVRGWDIGCLAEMHVGADGEDRVTIFLTSGSNGRYFSKNLGTFKVSDLREDRVEEDGCTLVSACVAAYSQLTEDRPEYLEYDIEQLRLALKAAGFNTDGTRL